MKFLRIFLVVMFLLSGCSVISPGKSATPPSPSASSGPTQDPAKGAVQGRLLLNGKPYIHGIIYISPVIKDKSGEDIIVGLDRMSALSCPLDANGQFNVVNVPPGRYGIILDLVSHGALLDHPDKNTSYLIDVAKGKTTNLGDLNYTNLPNP